MAILRALRDAGHTAYFAGGCVRDELLGIEPVDYDIATDALPEAIRALFRKTAAVGASFGVVLVKERGVTVEVATFRSDGPYSDRRRPDHVEFSDPTHDAQRRDFTINALFLDPLADPPGGGRAGVIDLVGGLADLDAGIIRAVGSPEQRLSEDHLRALRAVRFAARYGFAIEPATAEAIRRHANRLAGVSRERIGDELRRMMAQPSRARAADLLGDLGLDTVVLGDTPASTSTSTLERLSGEATFPACLACWALQRGGIDSGSQVPMVVSGWRKGLCLSNEERESMRDIMLAVLTGERDWGRLAPPARKRLAARPCFSEALAVIAARHPATASSLREQIAALAADGVGLAPESLINGDDLLAMGMTPGPVFARVLERVYDAQLEGRVRTKSQAMEFARELERPGSV